VAIDNGDTVFFVPGPLNDRSALVFIALRPVLRATRNRRGTVKYSAMGDTARRRKNAAANEIGGLPKI
jgi:hypothetical protein